MRKVWGSTSSLFPSALTQCHLVKVISFKPFSGLALPVSLLLRLYFLQLQYRCRHVPPFTRDSLVRITTTLNCIPKQLRIDAGLSKHTHDGSFAHSPLKVRCANIAWIARAINLAKVAGNGNKKFTFHVWVFRNEDKVFLPNSLEPQGMPCMCIR